MTAHSSESSITRIDPGLGGSAFSSACRRWRSASFTNLLLTVYKNDCRYRFNLARSSNHAAYLEDHGAAIVIDDADLQADMLPTIADLFAHPDRLDAMHSDSKALARPEAASILASAIIRLGETNSLNPS